MATNKFSACGIIFTEPRESRLRKDSCEFMLQVPKQYSENYDLIPCVIPKSMLGLVHKDAKRHILGQVHTKFSDYGHKDVFVVVYQVFSGELTFGENDVTLFGYPIHQPSYEGRYIDEPFLISEVATNFRSGESAYVPCVFWDDDIETYKHSNSGTPYLIKGHFQSRMSKKYKRRTFEVYVDEISERERHEKFKSEKNRN